MKTILIIGSGPGLSMAVARRFAREGWRVLLAARNRARLDAQVAQLRAAGGTAEAHVTDASDVGQIAALVDGAGAIDVLVYNAANIRKATLLEQPPQTFASDLMVNVGGAMAAVAAALPAMSARGSGAIILTGGGLAVDPHPAVISLSAGKAALRAFAIAQAPEAAKAGVHLTHVMVKVSISPQGAEDLAELYWTLQAQAPSQWAADHPWPPA